MIEKTMLRNASGKIKGVLTSTIRVAGKDKRVAHAYIMYDGNHVISVDIKKSRLTIEEVQDIAKALLQFVDILKSA